MEWKDDEKTEFQKAWEAAILKHAFSKPIPDLQVKVGETIRIQCKGPHRIRIGSDIRYYQFPIINQWGVHLVTFEVLEYHHQEESPNTNAFTDILFRRIA